MLYEIILFDLDGTVTDSGPGIMNSVRYALQQLGEEVPPQGVLRKFIGPPLAESFREFCGMTEQGAEEAVKQYREYYTATGMFENVLYPGIPEMLDRLREGGCRLAVSTSKPEAFAEQILDYLGIADRFEVIGGSCMDGSRSRKADVIAYVLERMDYREKASVLMVGDRRHDVEGAHRCGIDAAGVTYGYGSRGELISVNADYLADTPEELAEMICGLNRENA